MSLPEIDIGLELFSLLRADRDCPLPIKGRDSAVANTVNSQRATKVPSGLFQRTRPLSHRPIFKIHDPVWSRAADEISDKGAPDIVLLDGAKTPRNQTPQPGYIAWRVRIACDNSRTKNREALEADPLNRLFFEPHDPHIANPAFRGASHCREQRKPCDTPGPTTAGKAPDHANFEGLQLLLAPLQAAFADANTARSTDGIALRNHALRKPGHVRWKLGIRGIQDYLPHTGISGQRNRPAIDHHDFNAGRLGSQRTHHCGSHLPRATDDQDAKCHFGPAELGEGTVPRLASPGPPTMPSPSLLNWRHFAPAVWPGPCPGTPGLGKPGRAG